MFVLEQETIWDAELGLRSVFWEGIKILCEFFQNKQYENNPRAQLHLFEKVICKAFDSFKAFSVS